MEKGDKENLISIFGTCATRDVIHAIEKDKVIVKTQVARQTVVSAVSQPVNWQFDDVEFKSPFDKTSVQRDFEKTGFTRLKSDGSRYLIIDLVDERHPTLSREGSFVTKSYCLTNACPIKDEIMEVQKIEHGEKLEYCLLMKDEKIPLTYYMDLFAAKILDIYPSENIILHKVFFAKEYTDEEGQVQSFSSTETDWIESVNARLKEMYSYLETKFPGCMVIDICGNYLADAKNKWNLAPFHYGENYYLEFQSVLMKLLDRKSVFAKAWEKVTSLWKKS